MNSLLRINKFDGMVFSLLLMSPWIYLYFWCTNDSLYSLQLTGLLFFGFLFLYLRKIEAGTEAEVVFFEKSFKPNKHIWGDGFCLVPTLLPLLHYIGIHWLWDIRKNPNLIESQFNPNVNIYHHKDQRIPEFKVNSDATLFQSTVYRFFGNVTDWFFSLDSKDPELVYQKLGFRIIIVAVVLGWIGNFFPKSQPNIPQNNVIRNKETVTGLFSLIREKPIKYFPSNEVFEIDYEQNVLHYRYHDDVKLFSYHKVYGKDFPTISVKEKICAVVPAGMKIAFLSKIPPVYAVNMKSELLYDSKPEYLNFFRRNGSIFYLLFGNESKFLETSGTWRGIDEHWERVNYKIIAQALDKNDIPDGVLGGIVCF